MVWATTEGDKTLKVFWLVSFLYDKAKQTEKTKGLCLRVVWSWTGITHQASFAETLTSAASQAQCTLHLSLQLPVLVYTTVGQVGKNKQNEVLAASQEPSSHNQAMGRAEALL